MNRAMFLGLGCIAAIVLAILLLMPPFAQWQNGQYGLLMLALIVVAILLGFPTAFTLMGLGMLFGFVAFHRSDQQWFENSIFELMVQRTYGTMTNDVLISVPLFVFMGYIVERANIIDKLFGSVQRAMGNLPGSLAVATIITCAIFATATGIVGAVVTLMGLLALPAMLRAGYDVRLSAGAITAGGCLGILIPPSVLLILYGATAGVSVVQLYAGAFFPGLMLATLYVVYVVVRAWLQPSLAPRLPPAEPKPAPAWVRALQGPSNRNFTLAVLAAPVTMARARLSASGDATLKATPWSTVLKTSGSMLFPLLGLLAVVWFVHHMGTLGGGAQPAQRSATPAAIEVPAGSSLATPAESPQELSGSPGEQPRELGAGDPAPLDGSAGGAAGGDAPVALGGGAPDTVAGPVDRSTFYLWFGALVVVLAIVLLVYYRRLDYDSFDVLRELLSSFFPLAILIMAVLGSIVFGLATPSEAAAMGALGGVLLALAYRQLTFARLKEAVFLTSRTTAMVCWLFVGSALFSATFALLGGQELIEKWVLSLNLTPIEFLLLSQVIIFLLGWPLEWTEIIVIFMPIFIPLLAHFNIDPLFFGLIVALNLQTAFLSPPVAMAAFYLKGVAPPHVTLNQIFAGMMPFMAIQVFAIFLLYQYPGIGLWLPSYLYK
ncbi:MAG: TRAP transporter large permease subunit [bacterium]|jgi:TRAP-type mannitol/chloroaromatic compound transport system permease large subunit|nr:TRAP transporter large permease subunit [Betaproteobacteria bacterium]